MLGVERISARLHYLKSIWVNELKQYPNVEVVTPVGKNLSCAIASFRIRNKTSDEVADYLFKEHNIFTVSRTLGKDGCVRVTPSVYNSADEVRKFVAAVKLYANG
jgi:selenocysteine lyase/cysteine desulfurase